MSKWYAVYLERYPAKEGDIPDALFAKEQDALDWAYEEAMESVDIVGVDIPQISQHNPPKSHRVSLGRAG